MEKKKKEEYRQQAEFIKKHFQLVLDDIKKKFPCFIQPDNVFKASDYGWIAEWSLMNWIMPGNQARGKKRKIVYRIFISTEDVGDSK